MKDNLENKISLDETAQHAGYSVSYFKTIFSEKTSYPPMEYYNQLKIQRSCSYLQFLDLKIKEIDFRLGFYNPFHFSKSFCSVMEITRTECKKNIKKTKV